MEDGRAADVNSVDMDFFLDKDQRLERAVALRDARAKSLDSDAEMQATAANMIEVTFQPQGDRSLLRQMSTEGRSVINLSAPKSKANDPRAANKRLSADSVKLFWRVTGRDLEKAEALGNAELFVDPAVKSPNSDRKTLTAPRFDAISSRWEIWPGPLEQREAQRLLLNRFSPTRKQELAHSPQRQ